MAEIRERRVKKAGSTRELLLETAGQVFASVGFEGASGRDICERAGANAAAISYYFGGIEALHEAVVEEAHTRLVGLYPVLELVSSSGTAEDRLTRLFQMLLETAMDSGEEGAWPIKVLMREVLGKSSHLDVLRQDNLVPKLRIIRALIAEFMELPEDHGAATDACLAYLSVSVMLHMGDHKAIESAFPLFRASGNLTSIHFTEFMLGGIKRLAAYAMTQDKGVSERVEKEHFQIA